MAEKKRFQARICLLGVKMVEINIDPFYAPKDQILAKTWTGKNLAENALQLRRSPTPLMVIVAP